MSEERDKRDRREMEDEVAASLDMQAMTERAERVETFVRLLVEKAKDHAPGDLEEVLSNPEYWAGEYAHAEAMLSEVEALDQRAKRAEARVKELEDEVADDLVAANHQIESDEAEIETLRAERDALSADLSLAMSYYICDNGLGLDYHGSDEDFARKPGGKVNAEMERWKRTLGFGEDHRKHPAGDHCVFCNSQWPCEFAPEEDR